VSEDNNKPVKNVQIQIELDPETAQGVYANMAMVNHTENEFTLDFIYIQPQAPKAKVRSRVISSPKHAKRLLAALQDAVQQYESKFGVIALSGGPAPSGRILN
jgi:hypothetical protein